METSSLFRSYKRHYHKVARLVQESPMTFGLTITFSNQGLRAENSFPDVEKCMRLCVLMRPFLSPASSLSIDHVWTVLKTEFAEELRDIDILNVDEDRARMRQGPIAIVINNEHYTAERIYADISAADLFDDDEDVRRRLAVLMSQPPGGQLLWNQFYSYTTDSFYFASFIFDVIAKVEASDAYMMRYPPETPTLGPCIYCLLSDDPFTSEEHPLPEGFGSDSAVLPIGTVCDPCNSGLLSKLDQHLLDSPVLGLLRVWNVPHTKKGKLPRVKYKNAHIEKIGPRHIRIVPKDKSAHFTNEQRLENGMVSFTTTLDGKFDPIDFARSLYKVGLGMVAFEQGADFARASRYDRARQFIRDGEGFPNNLMMSTTCRPHHQIALIYLPFEDATPCAIDFYGIAFLFNLEAMPVLQLDDQIRSYFGGMNFVLHPLTRTQVRRSRREKGHGTHPENPPQS